MRAVSAHRKGWARWARSCGTTACAVKLQTPGRSRSPETRRQRSRPAPPADGSPFEKPPCDGQRLAAAVFPAVGPAYAKLTANRPSVFCMTGLAAFKWSARCRKCKLVRSLRIVPQKAMPIAPPRLRIMLNNPLAYFRRAGGRLPSPRFTAGATTNTCGNPRRICGRKSCAPPQSCVMKLKLLSESPNITNPNIISQRVSNLRANRM